MLVSNSLKLWGNLVRKVWVRMVEIGCVEMINQVATGEIYHQYINPRRGMPEEAFLIHGLSDEFLSDKPDFNEIAGSFLEFLGDARLIIHNADFDMGFLNSELAASGRDQLSRERATDTVRLARRKFPGASANLDALCKRFNIENTHRKFHGALLDAQLLADVYLQLIGGRQRGLSLVSANFNVTQDKAVSQHARPKRSHVASEEELKTHADFISRMKDPIWSL